MLVKMNHDVYSIIMTECHKYRIALHKANPPTKSLQAMDEYVTKSLESLGYQWAKNITVFQVIENFYDNLIK